MGAGGWRLDLGAGLRLSLAEDHRDRRVHFHVFGAFGDQDVGHLAFIDGFDFHRRLVGFDLGDDVARFDLVADLDVPFGELSLFHRRRKGGHQNLRRHVGLRPLLTH